MINDLQQSKTTLNNDNLNSIQQIKYKKNIFKVIKELKKIRKLKINADKSICYIIMNSKDKKRNNMDQNRYISIILGLTKINKD